MKADRIAAGAGNSPVVRDAAVDDAAACAAIDAQYVLNTAATFEIEAPEPRQMAAL